MNFLYYNIFFAALEQFNILKLTNFSFSTLSFTKISFSFLFLTNNGFGIELILLFLVLSALVPVLLTVVIFTVLERKVLAFVQRRRWPNVAGCFWALDIFSFLWLCAISAVGYAIGSFLQEESGSSLTAMHPMDYILLSPQGKSAFDEIPLPTKLNYKIIQRALYFDEVTIQPIIDLNDLFIAKYFYDYDSFVNIYIHFIALRRENTIHLELFCIVWI